MSDVCMWERFKFVGLLQKVPIYIVVLHVVALAAVESSKQIGRPTNNINASVFAVVDIIFIACCRDEMTMTKMRLIQVFLANSLLLNSSNQPLSKLFKFRFRHLGFLSVYTCSFCYCLVNLLVVTVLIPVLIDLVSCQNLKF